MTGTERSGWNAAPMLAMEVACVLAPMVAAKILVNAFPGAPFGVRALSALAVPACLVVATVFLRRRGRAWREHGMMRARRWWAVPLWALLIAAGSIVAGMVGRHVATALGLEAAHVDWFDALRGNAGMLALMLVIAWTTAAIGEEMLFRGYLMTRLSGAMGGRAWSWAVALAASAALFGLAHSYQGPAGMVTTGAVGAWMGCAYLFTGRRLWALMLAHGLVDTVGLIAIYAGAMANG